MRATMANVMPTPRPILAEVVMPPTTAPAGSEVEAGAALVVVDFVGALLVAEAVELGVEVEDLPESLAASVCEELELEEELAGGGVVAGGVVVGAAGVEAEDVVGAAAAGGGGGTAVAHRAAAAWVTVAA